MICVFTHLMYAAKNINSWVKGPTGTTLNVPSTIKCGRAGSTFCSYSDIANFEKKKHKTNVFHCPLHYRKIRSCRVTLTGRVCSSHFCPQMHRLFHRNCPFFIGIALSRIVCNVRMYFVQTNLTPGFLMRNLLKSDDSEKYSSKNQFKWLTQVKLDRKYHL